MGGPAVSQVPPLPPVQSVVDLSNQIDSNGMVPIIVQLNTPFQAEGYLSAAAIIEQRQRIFDTRSALLVELPTGVYKLKYAYTTTPAVALYVNGLGIALLAKSARVLSWAPDEVKYLTLAQSVPLVGAQAAADRGFTGSGQTIAVLDTGVDEHHFNLAGKVVSAACYSTTAGNFTSLCPNGQNSTEQGSAQSCTGHPDCAHGTHVAGIAVANGPEVRGVARDARLIAVQVFSRPTQGGRFGAFDSDVMAGLERVYELRNTFNIAAVNLSYGGGTFDAHCDRSSSTAIALTNPVANLRSVRIATVVASGNGSSSTGISSPACLSSVISVGNTTKDDQVNNSSNSTGILNLLAPGTSIRSTIPGNRFAFFTGTSMAAPHVAGAWAILKQQSDDSVDATLEKLAGTGVLITDPRNGITRPRIRVDRALNPAAPTGTLAFEATAFNVSENAASVVVTVTRTGGSSGAASVNYSTSDGTAAAGSDYSATSGTLNWANGDAAAKTFNVTIFNDTADELDETVNLTLFAVSGASLGSPSTATLTILDDDLPPPSGTLSFSSGGYLVNEGDGSRQIAVTRTGGSSGAASVNYSTSNGSATAGSDYSTTSGTLNWGNGDTTAKTFTVTIVNDATNESQETLNLFLSSASGATLGSPSSATLTINDDDPSSPTGTLAFSLSNYSRIENQGPIDIVVNRTGGSSGAASINYSTSNGSAVAGSDYSAASGTLNWNNGEEGSKSFSVAVVNDSDDESNETVNLALSNASGAALGSPGSAVLTIEDDDEPSAQPPPTPANFTWQDGFCRGQHLFSWSSVAGATRYELHRALGPSYSTWTAIYSGMATNYQDNLGQNQTAIYKVRACNSGACSAFSQTEGPASYHEGSCSRPEGP